MTQEQQQQLPVTKHESLLVEAGSTLESQRALSTELEACINFTSILLENPNGLPQIPPPLKSDIAQDFNDPIATKTVTNSKKNSNTSGSLVPGGVIDALETFESIHNSFFKESENATSKQKQSSNSQVYKACRNTALSITLKRSLEITNELQKKIKMGYTSSFLKMKQLQQDPTKSEEQISHLFLQEFYIKCQSIQLYHARHSSDAAKNKADEERRGNAEADGYDISSLLKTECESLENNTLFSMEEVLGKYLDLNSIHAHCLTKFRTLFIDKQQHSYVDFLYIVQALRFDSKWRNENKKKYFQLLQLLKQYLTGFMQRAFPLLNVESDVIQPVLNEVDVQEGKLSGDIPWDEISSAQELLDKISLEDLKKHLQKRNMKTGGKPIERAKRLYATKEMPLEKLPSKYFVKSTISLETLELSVHALLQQLKPIMEATIRRAERRLTQTLNEKERELEEDMFGNALTKDETQQDENSDEEEDAPIYNPKGVPLGWDGKPIPYWLFKLHGLNHFFTCEICGNESYRGRHNFEKHFTESKHAYGMRCLGIPNTKHFHGITKIDDAKNLWSKLSAQMEEDVFDPEKEEEYEDNHGNVLSRAAYEDLARQGML